METKVEPRKYKRKEFISFLQETVENFPKPSVKLEQYMTPYDVTADFFALLNNSGEIAGKIVADFCCGTGLYSAAAYFLDAKEVFSFDIDPAAINLCKEALENFEDGVFHVEQVDLTNSTLMEKYTSAFDTVIMNPPFGTKDNEGIDMALLKNAIKVILQWIKKVVLQRERVFVAQVSDRRSHCKAVQGMGHNNRASSTDKLHYKEPV